MDLNFERKGEALPSNGSAFQQETEFLQLKLSRNVHPALASHETK
jgi:hypothetical protein